MKYYKFISAALCFSVSALTQVASAQNTEHKQSKLQMYPGFGYNESYEKLQLDQEKAREKLISECMSRAGFKYIEGDYFEIEIGSDDVFTARDAEALVEELKLKDQLYEQQLPENVAGYYKALYGDINMDNPGPNMMERIQSGEGGCFGSAEREIVSVFSISSSLSKEYTHHMFSAYDDSQYKIAESKWSACVSETGIRFSNPIELRTAIVSGVGEPLIESLSENERKSILQASDRCAFETNIYGVLADARIRAEDIFLLKHKKQIQKSAELIPVLRKQVDRILEL